MHNNKRSILDNVHGHISFNKIIFKFIDTVQFQRLRYIKQLGLTYLVYPTGNHTRFEHSIGVAYLSGKLLRQLKYNQKELNITEKDIICVQLAGLLRK